MDILGSDMRTNLKIYNARIVTPLGIESSKGEAMSHLKIIENGMVEIVDGMITYVGLSSDELREGYYNNYWHYDAQGCCLLPGFVDSHTHFVFGGERAEEFSWRLKGESYMSIMKRGGGIASTVRATRMLSFKDMCVSASEFLDKMHQMGVTTVEGKSGYGLDRITELRLLEAMSHLNTKPQKKVDIVSTFLGAHALPKEYDGRSDEYIDFLIEEMLPLIIHHELATCCDVFCEEGVFTVEQSRRLLLAAQEKGLKAKIHADELVTLGGAELAAELQALSADHLLHVSDEGIRAMAEAGVVATLLPLTAFALKEPYARARDMIEAGCAVALATDLNPGSCFSGSIPLTFALACIYMNMTIEEAITALTLNGAAALGLADRIGSIEVGKQADMVLLQSSDYNMLPYYIGMNGVAMTIKRGVMYPIE